MRRPRLLREHSNWRTWILGAAALSGLTVVGHSGLARAQAPASTSPSSGGTSPQGPNSQAPNSPPPKSQGQETEEAEAGAEAESSEELAPTKSGLSVTDEEQLLAERRRREHERRMRWRRTNASTDLPERADVFALTVAGGVSLGSYEAGLIHTLTEALRRSPNSARLKVVTGASAGSANAMIAGTSACLEEVEEPEDSLGYSVWVNVGFDQLFDPGQVTADALFNHDAMNAGYSKVASRWREGMPKDCDFVYGAAVTREQGYDVQLAPGLVVPRQAERFVVRITGRGKKPAPAFENYLDPSQNYERPLLPLSAGSDLRGISDMNAIRQLVLASAAFPVAFPAVPIEHCTTAKRDPSVEEIPDAPPHCEVATRVDPFVDGGVFDNNPLGTAYQIATDGLIKTESGVSFRNVPVGGPEKPPEVVFGYIDPDLRNYSLYTPPKKVDDGDKDPMIGILARLGGQVLSSARGQELATLAERNPQALKRLWLLEASYPPVSEMVTAFFGFFERDFRDFDFHLGSYDALRDLRDHSGTMLGVEPFLKKFENTMAQPLRKIPKRYQKLGCILSQAEPDRYSQLQGLCEGIEMRNFRILLQLTIDRLWSNCRRLSETQADERGHLQCKRARGGLTPPVVDSEFTVRGARYQQPKETDFDYAMRLLSDYGFHFKDLGLEDDQSRRGRVAVRRRLANAVQALGNAQPGFSNRTAVLTAGRLMVNRIAYEPPRKRWYFMLGSSLAAGYLHRVSDMAPFYWNVDARHYAFRSLITDRPNEFAGALGVGIEWAILPLSGSILQFSLGTRVAYQFAATDSIGFDPCDEAETQGDSRKCSQTLIQVPLNLTVLERLRLSAMPVFHLHKQDYGHKVFDLELGFGGEFF